MKASQDRYPYRVAKWEYPWPHHQGDFFFVTFEPPVPLRNGEMCVSFGAEGERKLRQQIALLDLADDVEIYERSAYLFNLVTPDNPGGQDIISERRAALTLRLYQAMPELESEVVNSAAQTAWKNGVWTHGDGAYRLDRVRLIT